MNPKFSLDATDRVLLSILQREGRITATRLARTLGLGKNPCLMRVRRLEKEGIICRYTAHLNPNKINLGHLVYVQIKLNQTTVQSETDFKSAIDKIPQVLSCHFLSGGYDYLLKVRTQDMASYRTLLRDTLSLLPNLAEIASFPVIEEIKETSLLAIDGV